ncbi:unnamed protein product [Phytophthora fragariaefolia]|uniref:Endo-1,3-beta-glucanase btgC n=1 Tax=Phytophthora fragariaefolia TaxID=1490495 RepID=A0A9W6U4H7_9STRA|nr:unnamed protein product [Phytophthora fragariaefolia]
MVRVFSLSAAAVAVLASSTAALDQKLYGINYDLRQGPDWDPSKCKSADTIAADLKVLSTITSNVRTYSLSDCDVSGVLTAAKDLSLTVWLGVWVSEDSKVYDAEVKAFKELMSAGLIDSNVVGINVGSEAVYREDITAEQAIKYVNDFKKVMADNDISVPVSITDIIDTFVQYPDMLKAGDIVTINQFPFWEKVEADKAAAQFNKRIQPLIKMAGDMEVIISETGWPTGGSATNGSVASEENGATYLNDFYELAEAKKWKYYYFAGFDTPYKEKQADDATTVESHFGIFDETGTMKSAYSNLKFTKTGDYSTSGSSTSTTSGSTDSVVGTVAPGSGTSGTTSTGTTGTTGNSDATTSSTNSDRTSSATTADSGASQLMAASLAACLGVVSTMLWSLAKQQKALIMASTNAQADAAASGDAANEGLLVLVIDTNPAYWFAQGGSAADRAGLQQLISSTLVFVNSYLLLHRSNRIVIIAAHAGKSAMLYPDPQQDDTSGNAEQAAKVNAGVMQRLQQLSDAPLDPAKPNRTAVAASLSRALCFVQKSPDVSEHYIAIMNGIFSAQKKSVAVDACILATEHSSFMQQAAYLTGGIYYKPNDHSGLLQYLISIYLPDPSMRKLLKLPSQDSVDFRAMCFCHREVISTAPTIAEVIAERKANNTAAFITFVPCGFKTKADTVDILLGLQRGGASIIEVGIPYSDPQADGPTIQRAHQVGVDQGITLTDVLATVKEARTKGLTAPVVLMGYYNNIMQYGEDKICPDAQEAGVDGFIIVDLPPEEAKSLSDDAAKHGLSYIPLVSPTTSEDRMKLIDSVAHGFVYCVSLTGVTGARTELPPNLDAFMATSKLPSSACCLSS